MFCKHCGKEIGENAVICTGCGLATDAFFERKAQPKQEYTGPKKFPKLALAGLIISSVAAFCGYFLFIFTPRIIESMSFYVMYSFVMIAFFATVAGLILSIIGMVQYKKCKLIGVPIAAIIVSSLVFLYTCYLMMIYSLVLMIVVSVA